MTRSEFSWQDNDPRSWRRSSNVSSSTFPLRSCKVEAIEIHHLAPCRHKVAYKRLLGVVTGIDFRDGPELGIRTEDEIDDGTGPLERAGRPIPLPWPAEVWRQAGSTAGVPGANTRSEQTSKKPAVVLPMSIASETTI